MVRAAPPLLLLLLLRGCKELEPLILRGHRVLLGLHAVELGCERLHHREQLVLHEPTIAQPSRRASGQLYCLLWARELSDTTIRRRRRRTAVAEDGAGRSDSLLADLDELEQELAICLALLGGEIRLDLRRLALALVGLALGGGDCRLLVNCVALGRLRDREPFLTHLERRTRLAHLVGELAVQAVGTEL